MIRSLIEAIIRGQDFRMELLSLICALPAILFSLSFHEYAHAWSAHKLGDDTAKMYGRLTLNPVSHIHPIGFLMLLTVGFGFAKPVPVNFMNFKNRRKGMALVSLAGPLSNFILAFVFSFVLELYDKLVPVSVFVSDNAGGWIAYALYLVILYFVIINVNLGIFNLFPVPPLDGSKILYSILPWNLEMKLRPYEQYIQLALFVMLFLGWLDVPLSFLTGAVINFFGFIAEKVLFFVPTL